MSNIKGMDIEAGEQASAMLLNQAGELDQLTVAMTNTVDSFEWYGPDSDRTRDTWKGEYVKMLSTASTHVQEMARLISQQAEEQKNVSA